MVGERLGEVNGLGKRLGCGWFAKERCLMKYFDFYDGGAWRGRGNFSHP